jgi:hypothetical protein
VTHASLDDALRIALSDAGEQLAGVPEAFLVLFKRGDLSVELFAPNDVDTQQPHKQDEIYIVAAGTGVFRRAPSKQQLMHKSRTSRRRGHACSSGLGWVTGLLLPHECVIQPISKSSRL